MHRSMLWPILKWTAILLSIKLNACEVSELISTTGAFDTANSAQNRQSVYLLDFEKEGWTARVTTAAEWGQGVGGDATTKSGSMICEATTVNAATKSTISATANRLFAGDESWADSPMNTNYCIGVRLNRDLTFKNIKITCRYQNAGASTNLELQIFRVRLQAPYPAGSSVFFDDEVDQPIETISVNITSSLAEETFTSVDEPVLTRGDYIFMFVPDWSGETTTGGFLSEAYIEVQCRGATDDLTFLNANYRDKISLPEGFSFGSSLLANNGTVEVGQTGGKINSTIDGSLALSPWTKLANCLANTSGTAQFGFDGIFANPFEFNVSGYETDEHITFFAQVTDESGAAQTPVADGELRLNAVVPIGWSVDCDVYGADNVKSITGASRSGTTVTITSTAHGFSNSDSIYIHTNNANMANGTYTISNVTANTFDYTEGSGAITWGSSFGQAVKGRASVGTNMVDGDAITSTYYDYYQFDIDMTRNSAGYYWDTPDIRSVEAHFKQTQTFVRTTESFGGYPPLVDRLPAYEVQADPKESKASISRPSFSLVRQKSGMFTSPVIDDIITTYFVQGKEAIAQFGFVGLAESSFINISTAVVRSFDIRPGSVIFHPYDALFLSKDKLGIDQVDGYVRQSYVKEAVDDTIIDILSRGGIPDRLINDTEIGSMESDSYSGFELTRFIRTPEDSFDLLRELSEALQCVIFIDESGKVTARRLSNETSNPVRETFTEDNAWVSDVDFGGQHAANVWAVRAGYFNSYTQDEDETSQTWYTAINAQSITDIGRMPTRRIDNKWFALDTALGTHEAQQVANQGRTDFGYGDWRISVRVSNYYLYLQIGDHVNITTDRILYKGYSGENTWRAAITSKKLLADKSEVEFGCWIYDPTSN